MEDDLMRLFGGDRLKGMMERLKVPEDVPLENKMVSRSIESAQKRVEGRNFDIRRHVVQYDDVMNRHREIIYTRRQKILVKLAESEDEASQSEEVQPLHQDALEAMRNEATSIIASNASGDDSEMWDIKEILETIKNLHPQILEVMPEEKISKAPDRETVEKELADAVVYFYERKCEEYDSLVVSQAERVITLQSIDTHWMDHIDDMSHLREQVSFSGFAQRDPLIEYKDQGFRKFEQLLAAIDSSIVRALLQADFVQFTPRVLVQQGGLEGLNTNEAQIESELTETGVGANVKQSQDNPVVMRAEDKAPQQQRSVEKVGRNDPCPCGSGKKYKKCHG
jgi:preprotein translocase subunit SecA